MRRSPAWPVLAAALCLLPFSALSAQLRSPGQPMAALLSGDVPSLAVAVPDVATLRLEDAANEAARVPGPLRYGVPVAMPFDFTQIATWEITADGQRLVGRTRLQGPGAYSLGVEFLRFDLPEDGAFFLYDDALDTVFGAYTRANAAPDGEFVIEPFPGDSVILEYSQSAARALAMNIVLRGVIYDYRDLFALENSLHDDEGGYLNTCVVNANCPEGAPYVLQRRGAVRTISGGGFCSGSILNNTAQDRTPYLYTANHCGTGSGVVVRFRYETPNCTGGGAPTSMNMSGATLLATDLDTDGRLMRLNNSIPDSFNPYYAGWSRATANLTLGVGMHHPGGSPKNVAIDNNGGGQITANFAGIGPVKCWSMNFHVGGTSGGSSGSPLYDQNGRVRGTLTGGPSGNCAISYYGRFHNFWNETNIANWLDPLGTNPTTLDGLDPFADLIPAAIASIGPTSGAAGGFTTVTVNGSGFDGVTAVTFGGVHAKSFQVLSINQLTAVTPGGTSGATVSVGVTDSFGTAVLSSAFTYTPNPPPSVDTVGPHMGLLGGGTVVTLTGPSLLGVNAVHFGGVPGTGLQLLSPTQVQVTSPGAASTGAVDLLVLGDSGSTLLPGGFTYFTPGSFESLTPGVAGASGIPPIFSGSGDLTPGGSGFTLTTVLAPPNSTGMMFFSLAPGAAPFKGGTLYTFPVLLGLAVPTTFLGTITLHAPVDPSTPSGVSFVLQQLFADPAAVAGVSMTNGLVVNLGSN